MAETDHYAVLDVGGTKMRFALWDGSNLQKIDAMETPKVSASDFVATIQGALQGLFKDHSITGLGVSTAGPVDVVHGCIRNPANLGNGDASWLRFEIKQDLQKALSVPVVVDNDAAMTALGQYKHFEKERVKDLVVITLGTGLGVGALVNGELARAGQQMHPELGHFIIGSEPDPDYQTPFGHYPTMESFLSGFHFAQRVGKKLGRELTGSDLIHLSEEQDPVVQDLWESYSQRMAITLSNLYLIYFPRKFVFAGGFAMVAAPFFLNRTESLMAEILRGRVEAGMPLPDIEISTNHDELPLLGAAYRCQTLFP